MSQNKNTTSSDFSFLLPNTLASTTAQTGFRATPQIGFGSVPQTGSGGNVFENLNAAAANARCPPATATGMGFGAAKPVFSVNGAASTFGATTAAQSPALLGAPAQHAVDLNFSGLPLAFSTPIAPKKSDGNSFTLGAINTNLGIPKQGFSGRSLTFENQTLTVANIDKPPTSFVGLGGMKVSPEQYALKAKETLIPDAIFESMKDLEKYIASDKDLSSEIGRISPFHLTPVTNKIVQQQWAVNEVISTMKTNLNQIKAVRQLTLKALGAFKMAQNTQDTPAGLQFENIEPFKYIRNLAAEFEHDLINMNEQITFTENYMNSLNNPETVTPAKIKRCLLQIHESFIALAGRVQRNHEKVEALKQQVLQLRMYNLGDATNIFADLEQPPTSDVTSSDISARPTTFSNVFGMGHSAGAGNANNQAPK